MEANGAMNCLSETAAFLQCFSWSCDMNFEAKRLKVVNGLCAEWVVRTLNMDDKVQFKCFLKHSL